MDMKMLYNYLEARKESLEKTRKNSTDEGLLPRIDEIERTMILIRAELKTNS